MRPNGTKRVSRIPSPSEQKAATMRSVLDGTEIRIAYKMSYVMNFYREPSYRWIERNLGLTRPEIIILVFLNFQEGVSASDICELSGHLKASISRGIIMLERKKLLRRSIDAEDNRRQNLFLTRAGRALYARYIPILKDREAAMLGCLTEAEHKSFERILDKLVRHVPQWASIGEL